MKSKYLVQVSSGRYILDRINHVFKVSDQTGNAKIKSIKCTALEKFMAKLSSLTVMLINGLYLKPLSIKDIVIGQKLWDVS